MGSDIGVIIADDREIFRHALSQAVRRLDRIPGDIVVDTEQGRDLRVLLEQSSNLLQPVGAIKVEIGQIGVWHLVFLQSPQIAVTAFVQAGEAAVGTARQPDAAVASFDQVGHGLVGGVEVIGDHRIVALRVGVAIDQHHRRRAQVGGCSEIGLQVHADHQQAID